MNERMLPAASEAHSSLTDSRRRAQARPQSLLQQGSCAPGRLQVAPRRAGRPTARDLREPPSQACRWGQGVGADTPPVVPPAPGRGRRLRRPTPHWPTPRRTPGRPPRAGALPRAEDPGGASSRQACELPPSRAPGELSLAAAAEPAAALPSPPHPAPCRGSCRGGVRVGRPSGLAAVGTVPPASGPSRPSQPVAAGASGAWSAGSPPRPGRPPAAGATFQNQTSVAAFGNGTLPGPRRLHCFLPRFPLALLPRK